MSFAVFRHRSPSFVCVRNLYPFFALFVIVRHRSHTFDFFRHRSPSFSFFCNRYPSFKVFLYIVFLYRILYKNKFLKSALSHIFLYCLNVKKLLLLKYLGRTKSNVFFNLKKNEHYLFYILLFEPKTMFSIFFKSYGVVHLSYLDKGKTID